MIIWLQEQQRYDVITKSALKLQKFNCLDLVNVQLKQNSQRDIKITKNGCMIKHHFSSKNTIRQFPTLLSLSLMAFFLPNFSLHSFA